MNLDFSKPEYGPEHLRALIRESFAEAARFRREHGIPEPSGGTFLGFPIVVVDQLESKEAEGE